MKKGITIVFLALLSVCAGAHTKLTPELLHFMSVHGDLGYSALLHNIPNQAPGSGINTAIGGDYRLYYNNFIFSAGLEMMYGLNSNPIAIEDLTIPMYDTEEQPFDMHVHVDKVQDLCHMLNVNIPILFGGEWGRFYFLAGPKVAYNLYGSTSSKAFFTTTGVYDRYPDDFENMKNHEFISGQTTTSGSQPVNWNKSMGKLNVMAHVEIGARFSHMFKHKQFRINPDKVRMYLAGYVDFSVMEVYKGVDQAAIFSYSQKDGEPVKYSVSPLLKSNLAEGKVFRNFNIGIKYTVAFELPQKGKSYVYDYEKDEKDYIIRGGNQTIDQ